MSRTIIILLAVSIMFPCCSPAGTTFPEHPYLVMTEKQEKAVKSAIRHDAMWAGYHASLMAAAEELLDEPVCSRILTGKKRKLLGVSRECLRRILLCGYAYRISGDERYAERGVQEMLNIAGFTDWNPRHFLDTSEMTLAMAVGYDWLYGWLDEQDRKTIEDAIVEKGLLPSCDTAFNSWLGRKNNWNQVCNGGMVLGALAVYARNQELADDIIARAVESVKLPMAAYAPDGGYPEGYMYWGYGTTYNILMIDALKSVFGTDYGLSGMPGFMNTGKFMLNMVLSDGKSFNYGDCANSGRINPAVFWFADRTSDPSLLWPEKYFYDRDGAETGSRYAPLVIIWGADIRSKRIGMPSSMMWCTKTATTPVALMRTSWEFGESASLAVKGGTAQSGHCHLDAGSFVYVKDGIRWIMDLGPQKYDSLDEYGVDQWNKSQDSQRWEILRYNNMAHNTLTFDGKLQNVFGHAGITDCGSSGGTMQATVNLSGIYKDQVASAVRTVKLYPDGSAGIRDSIRTLARETTMRWNIATEADAEVVDGKTIVLSKGTEKLEISIDGSAAFEIRTWSAEPANIWDQPNPGVTFVGFESSLPPGSCKTFDVRISSPDN